MPDFLDGLFGRHPAPEPGPGDPAPVAEGSDHGPAGASPLPGDGPDVDALLDSYDDTAVLVAEGRLVVNVSQVQDNLEELMDRMELDVDHAWAMEDVVSTEAWHVMCSDSGFLGWVALTTVVAHAHELLERRDYPVALVRRPLAVRLRIEDIAPSIVIPPPAQEIAKDFLDAGLGGDGQIEHLRAVFEDLSVLDRMTVIHAVLVFFNLKVNAMKYRLGRP